MRESEVLLEFEFENGLVLRGVIDRVHAPMIVEDIKSRLPIEGRIAFLRGELKITLGLSRGNQKPVKSVKKGQIAYMPLGDSLCIYTKDMETFSPVNVIGRIISEEDLLGQLREVRRGSKVKIKRVD